MISILDLFKWVQNMKCNMARGASAAAISLEDKNPTKILAYAVVANSRDATSVKKKLKEKQQDSNTHRRYYLRLNSSPMQLSVCIRKSKELDHPFTH